LPWFIIVRTVANSETRKINRRAFLFSGLAAAVGGTAKGGRTQTPRLETLTEWLNASRRARELALRPCLDRIREMDSSIHAWVQISPQRPTGKGKLSEIPFGAKDIMETRGLSTEYGSAIYKGRIGTADAAIVRELRQRGAILLGKTHCTAFAYRQPAPTRNPRDLERTPGGSSSGSAAAVAAGMVPIALGTQTRGSVLRPASYCGVTGFKVSYGLLSTEGVLPLAKSLDTLGFFTHTPTDMLALWESMGHPRSPTEDFALGAPEQVLEVEPEMATAFKNAITVLERAGVSIRPLDIASMLAKLNDAARTVEFYEGARFHQQRFNQYGTRLGDLGELVQKGLRIRVEQYDEARRYIAECRARVAEMYKATPVILVPAATGPAPFGLGSTGDASMNAPWTALGTPAISIPMPVKNSLPLGLQLTGDRGQDARVLCTAVRVQRMLGGGPQSVSYHFGNDGDALRSDPVECGRT
jgi:Asp-tRNA(Asn)/Glu-tRNA(Gln) amidotransferase A subunit family amidase